MLKFFADFFKLTEKQMTVKALRRIKWLTVFALPALPIAVTLLLNILPANVMPFVWVMFSISFMSFMVLSFTKFMNRFWARDKYLDEWERARKHEAMAFAMQFMTYIFMAIMCAGIFGDLLGVTRVVDVPVSLYGIGVLAACIMMTGFMAVHLYLLFTTKAIDSGESLPV